MPRSVAIIHPYLSVRGGAEGVCFEAISTFLKNGDAVTVFTAETAVTTQATISAALGPLVGRLNVRTPIANLAKLTPLQKPPVLLGYAVLLRAMRRIDLSEFDVVFSTFGECDLVRDGRQVCYIHFPVMHSSADSVARLGGRLEKSVDVRLAYTRLARLISGFKQLPDNALLLTNSNWTKAQIIELLGPRKIGVVNPPVQSPGVELSICEKQTNQLACLVLGRFEAYKRQDLVVRAMDRAARQSKTKAKVHFAGRGAEKDIQRLRGLGTDFVEVFIHQNASTAELGDLVAKCHIAVSAFRHEHFGMATAELLTTGLPVFVPNGGGQPEVVGDSRFVFEDEGELTNKIQNLMTGEWSYSDIQQVALARGAHFAEGRFATEILDCIEKSQD